MNTKYRIPHIVSVEVPRRHAMRLTFEDGLVRELEFLVGGHEGTVFEPAGEPHFRRSVVGASGSWMAREPRIPEVDNSPTQGHRPAFLFL